MLIDGGVHGPAAREGLGRWVRGVAFQLGGGVASIAVHEVMAAFELWEVGSWISMLCRLVILAGGFIALGGLRAYGRALPAALGGLAKGAVALVSLDLAVDLLFTVNHASSLAGAHLMDLFADPVGDYTTFLDVVGSTGQLARGVGIGLALLLVQRAASAQGAPVPDGLFWGALGATGARLLLPLLRFLDGPSVPSVVYWGLFVAADVLLLLVLRAHRESLPAEGPAPAETNAELADPAWAAPGRALALYHRGIVIQLLVSVLGGLLGVLAGASRNIELVKGIMVLVAVGTMLVQLVILTGALRYARQLPELAPGKGAAQLGGTLLVITFLVNVGATVLIVRAFGSGRLRHLFDLQDQLPWVQGAGQALGLFALLALLVSFGEVAGHIERHDLAERTGGLKVALPVLAILGLVFKAGAAELGVVALALGLVFLVGALWALIAYLKLVRDVGGALRERAGLPT